MIYIFEGMDRCGKDTQIKKFIQQKLLTNENPLPYHILHYSAIPNNDITMNKNFAYSQSLTLPSLIESSMIEGNFKNKIIGYKYHLIFNRSYLGEYVYGTLYRNYNPAKVIIDTEAEFKKRGLLDHIKLFVLIDSSFKCVTDRDDGNSLSQASLELAEKEQILFLEVFKWTSITSKKLIDIANKSIEEVSNLIVSSE